MRAELRLFTAFTLSLALALGAIGIYGSQSKADEADASSPMVVGTPVLPGQCPVSETVIGFIVITTCPANPCPDGSGTTCLFLDRFTRLPDGTLVKIGKSCDC